MPRLARLAPLALALLLGPLPAAPLRASPAPLRLEVLAPERPPRAGESIRVRLVVHAAPEVRRWPLLLTARSAGTTLQPAVGRRHRSGDGDAEASRPERWPWRLSWPLLARQRGPAVVHFEALGYACSGSLCRAVRARAELRLRVE